MVQLWYNSWEDVGVTASSQHLEDVPFGNLPLRTEKVIFDHNTLDLVAVEVRWASPLGNIEQAAAVQMRDVIEAALDGVSLPVIERVEQHALTVEVGEGHATQKTVEYGHVLRTQDQSISISVLPDSLGIQLGAYLRWSESMKPLINAALGAAIDALNPGASSRTGLRYVNRITDESCTAPKDWVGKVSPALTAPYTGWGLQDWVQIARQQVEFALEENHRATLRHGALSPTEYLVDVDVYSQRTQAINVDDMLTSFTRMNRTSMAIFQQCVPIEYMRSRQPEGASA